MTEEKTKTLSVRVTGALFNRLKQEADEQEISLAEHVRNIIENDRQTDDKSAHIEYIQELKDQIAYLQNEMQNERMNNTELMRLLDQQQQLSLTNNKRIELLETELAKEEKTSWIKRIFKG